MKEGSGRFLDFSRNLSMGRLQKSATIEKSTGILYHLAIYCDFSNLLLLRCIRAETIERCEAKASADRYPLRKHALALIFGAPLASIEASGQMVCMSLPQLALRRQVRGMRGE